ncbi:hypothetical protein N431DRAFT_558729 [Stipitochalara longipes BDJ]|nr:hypothetical protein N431DRAFT_558729 [Stipitochalara longipes BDJ]
MSQHFSSLWKSRLGLNDNKSQGASEQRPYVYSPLKASSKKIRLLTLLPGIILRATRPCHTPGAQKKIRLLSILGKALWKSQRTWRVHYSTSGILTGRELFGSMLSVNQQDVNERAHQVSRMADIYTLADYVVVWLGPEAKDSCRALRTLHKIGSMVDADWDDLTMKPSDEARATGELHWADRESAMPFKANELDPVLQLLERPWFERLWVRQEIALATKAFLVCGLESIPWSRFQNAIFYIETKIRKNKSIIANLSTFLQHLFMIYLLCAPNRGLSLRKQIYRTQKCKYLDPRDRVYALLSISGIQGKKVIVDYRKSADEVYQDAVLQYYTWQLNFLTDSGCDLDGSHVLDTYCRTLLCDDTNDCFDPTQPILLGLEESKQVLRSLLDTSRPSPLISHSENFIRIAGTYLKNRSFFWAEDGRMGLGPGLTRATDEIVVFPGCPSPMVLRPSQNGNDRYQVVGECYVQNLMCGEALLGPLSANYTRIKKLDRTTGFIYPAFRDVRSGEFQDEDPRFGLLHSQRREDGMRRVYPTGLPGEDDKEYIGLKVWTSDRPGVGEKVEVMRNDLQPFLLE